MTRTECPKAPIWTEPGYLWGEWQRGGEHEFETETIEKLFYDQSHVHVNRRCKHCSVKNQVQFVSEIDLYRRFGVDLHSDDWEYKRPTLRTESHYWYPKPS